MILKLILSCDVCKPGQTEESTFDSLDELLSNLSTVGWPICTECGSDMNYHRTEQTP